jgi:hypothetical protein
MAEKRGKPEEIVSKLRQGEVPPEQGMTIVDMARQIGVSEQTYYRWRKLYDRLTAPCAAACNRCQTTLQCCWACSWQSNQKLAAKSLERLSLRYPMINLVYLPIWRLYKASYPTSCFLKSVKVI